MKSVALALAFRETPPRRKLEPLVAELTALLEREFNRVVGLMVAQAFLRRFDELDDLITETIPTSQFDKLFEQSTMAGFTGISIAAPDVSDVVDFQKSWGSDLVKGVLQNSAKQLNDIIGKGIADGLGREQIADLLYKQQNDDGILPPWRARLIAQTEVIRSYNAGARVDKVLSGYTHLKWLDGQRGACPSCRAMDGRVISIKAGGSNAKHFVDGIRGFVVRHPPLHPGCRCTILGATQEEYDAQEAKPLTTVPSKPTAVPGVSQLVPAKPTASDEFRKWYALHGDGKTGVAAAQAYAKFKGQPMKKLMDEIKQEGYDVKTLIAHPIGTALPPRNKAIKIPAPGASAKKKVTAAPVAKPVTLSKLEPGKVRPDDFWDELVQYKPQAGSNPGGFYQHPKTGEKFYIKEYKDMGQAQAELAALQTFRQLGFVVPNARVVNRGGKSVYVSELLDDIVPATQASLKAYFDKHPDELVKLHLGAAVTSNWDVIGLSFDNMAFVKGKPAIIDAGGSYAYRAKGGSKPYGVSTSDFDTLMNASINANSAAVFGKLYKTVDEYDVAIATVRAMRTEFDDLFKAMPAQAQAQWSVAQKLRLEALEDLLVARRAGLAAAPAGIISTQELADMAAAFKMDWENKAAVVKYSGSWAYAINDILRTGKKIPDYDIESVKALDAAMKPTTKPHTVYRGIGSVPKGVTFGIGVEFPDAGFMSTSVDRTVALNFAGGSPDRTFRIEVPVGTMHVPMNGLHSSHTREHELLLARGAQIVITGKDPITGDWIATVRYD